jgi:sigma54-dependent transcription regulator
MRNKVEETGGITVKLDKRGHVKSMTTMLHGREYTFNNPRVKDFTGHITAGTKIATVQVVLLAEVTL